MKTRRKKQNPQLGAALLEVIVAIGIVTLVMTTIVSLVTVSLKSASLAQQKTLGTKYSQEGLESLRQMRNILGWSAFAATIRADGTNVRYCLPSVPKTAAEFTALTNAACSSTQFVDPKNLFQRQADIVVTTVGSRTSVAITLRTTWNDSGMQKQSVVTQQFEEYNLSDAPSAVVYSPLPYIPPTNPPSPVPSANPSPSPSAAPASWKYRRAATATNTTGATQVAYQMPIVVDTATLITAGKMKADCSDARVTDAAQTPIPFWVDKNGPNACNTAATRFFTKPASLPAGATTLYFYYGNPQAAVSTLYNGKLVFDFFDDFEAGVLDSAVWSATGVTGMTAGKLAIATGAVYSKAPVVADVNNKAYEARLLYGSLPVYYAGMALSNAQSIQGGNAAKNKMVMLQTNANLNLNMMAWAADGSTASYNLLAGSQQFVTAPDGLFEMGFGYQNTAISLYKDYGITGTVPVTMSPSNTYAPYMIFGFFLGSSAGTQDITDMQVDFVSVRKFMTGITSVVSGTEEAVNKTGL